MMVCRACQSPWKSGIKTSIVTWHRWRILWMVAAKWVAPPSARSSRVTDVITTCLRPSDRTALPICSGSFLSGATGEPHSTAQKPQLRVQVLPKIRNVAVLSEKHSHWFGQRASWQTVFSPDALSKRLTPSYSGDVGRRSLSQGGFWDTDLLERFKLDILCCNLNPTCQRGDCSFNLIWHFSSWSILNGKGDMMLRRYLYSRLAQSVQITPWLS